MKKNHLRYTQYNKYNYYYYDIDSTYDPELMKKHSQKSRYLLSVSTKCIFTKLNCTIQSIGKRHQANALCTTFDDQTVHNHMLLFKMIAGTTTYFDIFSSQLKVKNLPDGVRILPCEQLGCNFQNHNKQCYSLILHVMKPDDIQSHFKSQNRSVMKI